eukprot:COSAG01_NODE_29171_length_643_cov_1.564338_2_plen_26_part_01
MAAAAAAAAAAPSLVTCPSEENHSMS